jgi:hypothetical protein
MSKPAGKCVFCYRPGRLTHGHVWPKWLRQVLPTTAVKHEQETGRFYTFTPDVKGPEYEIRTENGPARSRQPRNTCSRCNSGWMSSIEGFAKYAAVPLIQGRRTVLNISDQFSLAALLSLIAIRLPYLGIMRAVTLEDVDCLRHYREPSDNWKIWIANFRGNNLEDHSSKYYALQLDPLSTDEVGPEHCNAQVTTLVIGQLCAHIFYSPVMDFSGYDGVELCSIWPPSDFDIDTRAIPVLDDRATLWLHETFARTMPHRPA